MPFGMALPPTPVRSDPAAVDFKSCFALVELANYMEQSTK